MFNNIEMEIARVKLNQRNNHTAIILKEKNGERYLPIKAELFEVDAIAVKLNEGATPRPLVYDLLCALIQTFGGKVCLAVIHDFHNNTLFAKLVVEVRRKKFEFDCCPTDAIAVAIRAHAPICVESPILEKYGKRMK